MLYRLEYRRSVKKELRNLNTRDRRAVVRKIEELARQPRPDGSVKLKGSQDLFRVRCGEVRVVYQLQKQVLVVIVIRVGHRREVYKNL